MSLTSSTFNIFEMINEIPVPYGFFNTVEDRMEALQFVIDKTALLL